MKRKDLIKGLGFSALGSLCFQIKPLALPILPNYKRVGPMGIALLLNRLRIRSYRAFWLGRRHVNQTRQIELVSYSDFYTGYCNINRSQLQRVFIMFKCAGCSIRNVHIYDGSSKVQEFNNLMYDGEHRINLDAYNTYNLSNQHKVLKGVGVTFFCVASIGFDNNIAPSRLIVGAAGGNFLS